MCRDELLIGKFNKVYTRDGLIHLVKGGVKLFGNMANRDESPRFVTRTNAKWVCTREPAPSGLYLLHPNTLVTCMLCLVADLDDNTL